MTNTLQGKTALITGSSRGIGRAMAQQGDYLIKLVGDLLAFCNVPIRDSIQPVFRSSDLPESANAVTFVWFESGICDPSDL
jgi:hypothetical protein